jgi:hypothetical protein
MPDPRERFNKYDRLPHFCSRCDCLYQMNKKNCKREFENCVSLLKWFWKAREVSAVVGFTVHGEHSSGRINERLVAQQPGSPRDRARLHRNRDGSAAKRRKNAAHGASRGKTSSPNHQAPEGRKKHVPHIRRHLASHDFPYTPTPLIKADFRQQERHQKRSFRKKSVAFLPKIILHTMSARSGTGFFRPSGAR